MAQKWNLQDIVPPERTRRTARPADVRERGGAVRPSPAREMRMQRIDTVRTPARAPKQQRSYREEYPEAEQEPQYENVQTAEGTSYEEPVARSYQEPAQSFDETESLVARLDVTDGRLARVRRIIFSGVAVALLGFVAFGVTILMSGAEITVKPKMHDTNVNATFEAKLKPGVGELGYELLTLEEEGERQVAATGKAEVNEKAKGEITIYNGFSSTPQKLVKSTRFEAPGGLIFRIEEGVTIPGYTKDSAGNLKPGSVRAKVLADGTGETYNIKDVRLTVPGLKGSEQYDSIYGEVDKTVGITGGFEGTKYLIDETELATVKQKLHMELRDKLLARIAQERPNGFIVYQDAVTFVYDTLPSSGTDDQTAVIKERARLMVPLLNEAAFASFLAKQAVPGYTGDPVRIEDSLALKFAYESGAVEDISKQEVVRFTLSGPTRIIWRFDSEQLKKDLSGTKEAALPATLAKYPSIDKAKAVVRPIWVSTFPKDPEEIVVTEVASLQ